MTCPHHAVLLLCSAFVTLSAAAVSPAAAAAEGRGASREVTQNSLRDSRVRLLNIDEQGLVGRWKMREGHAGLGARFEFRADGTYSYEVSKGRLWVAAHMGTFAIRPSRQRSVDRILVLTPTEVTKDIPDTEAHQALHENRLMDHEPREFKIRDSLGTWPAPTKTLQDLDRDPTGVMEWWITRDVRP